MRVKIEVPNAMKEYFGDDNIVEVQGNTIRECFHDLTRRFPDTEQRLFKSSKLLSPELVIFINGWILFPIDFDRPVEDGDKLSLLFLADGG